MNTKKKRIPLPDWIKDSETVHENQDKGLIALLTDLHAKSYNPEGDIIKMAMNGDFSDFDSELIFPLIMLETALKLMNYNDMIVCLKKGKYDHDRVYRK